MRHVSSGLELRETVDAINRLFPSIYKKYHSRLRRSVAGYDITLRNLYLLKMVGQLGRSGVGDVARAMNLTSSTISTLAKRMERKGLIRRHRPEGDERRVELDLTAASRRMMRDVPPALEPGLLTHALRKMAKADRQMLLRSLRKLDAVGLSAGNVSRATKDGRRK